MPQPVPVKEKGRSFPVGRLAVRQRLQGRRVTWQEGQPLETRPPPEAAETQREGPAQEAHLEIQVVPEAPAGPAAQEVPAARVAPEDQEVLVAQAVPEVQVDRGVAVVREASPISA